MLLLMQRRDGAKCRKEHTHQHYKKLVIASPAFFYCPRACHTFDQEYSHCSLYKRYVQVFHTIRLSLSDWLISYGIVFSLTINQLPVLFES
jgi:hypothetical protein